MSVLVTMMFAASVPTSSAGRTSASVVPDVGRLVTFLRLWSTPQASFDFEASFAVVGPLDDRKDATVQCVDPGDGRLGCPVGENVAWSVLLPDHSGVIEMNGSAGLDPRSCPRQAESYFKGSLVVRPGKVYCLWIDNSRGDDPAKWGVAAFRISGVLGSRPVDPEAALPVVVERAFLTAAQR
ncbi:hypothetical protein V5P93_001574 [Actinokineospora auranticolor]|nr:hypothetical protein [Actinokineospora auranticolor]